MKYRKKKQDTVFNLGGKGGGRKKNDERRKIWKREMGEGEIEEALPGETKQARSHPGKGR